jgi:hypothetical protein
MGDILDRLRPEVADFRCEAYHLGRDLASLDRARAAEAREAVVLYAARVLEALSAEALRRVGLDGRDNSFSNLQRLEDYNLAPPPTLSWAHALRRMGNAVRHARAATGAAAEDAAAAFLEFWLHWFFCAFAHGPLLPALAREGEAAGLARDEELSAVMARIEADDEDAGAIADEALQRSGHAAMRVPAVLAALAERLLREGRNDQALRLLQAAGRPHQGDLRVQQLTALCYSRSGRLDRAVDLLEPIYRRHRTDAETVGIMAGVYKRLWQSQPSEREWLSKSLRAYESGYHAGEENTYLGVNLATTALLLDDHAKAEAVAEKVRSVLLGRRRALAEAQADRRLPLSLWDQLTLAEASLLLGDAAGAREAFGEAAGRHPHAAGAIDVARRQLALIAERIGAPADAFGQEEAT